MAAGGHGGDGTVTVWPTRSSRPTLFEVVGGEPFFRRLVDAFYDGVAGDDVLVRLYPEAPDLTGRPAAAAAVPRAVLGRPDDVLRRARPPPPAPAPPAVPHRARGARPLARAHDGGRSRWRRPSCPTRRCRRGGGADAQRGYFHPAAEQLRNDTGPADLPAAREGSTAPVTRRSRSRDLRKDVRRRSGRSTGSASTSPRARSTPCSARTAPASRRRSRSSRATARGRPATSRVLGEDPGRAGRDFRDRIGIVLQSSGVEHELTVREAVTIYGSCYSLAPAGRRRRRARRPRPPQLDQRVGHLSGGQRRRLDLALGIVGNPALLFLDEPTTGFDPAARRQAWELVRALCSGGTTVLLTTHYLDEAEHLADRVGVLAGGPARRRGHARRADRRRPARRSCASTCPAGTTAGDLGGVLPADAAVAARPRRVHDDDADGGRPRRHRLGGRAGHRADRPRRHPAVAGGRVPAARRRRARARRR